MSPAAGESSLLLWVMAAAVAMLAAYLFVGWVRRAQSVQGWRGLPVPALLAAMAMGLGMTSAMVLALSAEALSFPLGYRWLMVPALVFGPIVACLPMAWWLTRRQNWLALIGCGLLLAAVAVTVQCCWILAAGLAVMLIADFALRSMRGYFLDLASKRIDLKLSAFIMERVLGLRLEERPASAGSLAAPPSPVPM